MPSLYTLIHQDHRYMQGLIDQLTADPAQVSYDDAARRHVPDFLIAAESRHEAAEELVLWIRFGKGDSLRQLAAEFNGLARAHKPSRRIRSFRRSARRRSGPELDAWLQVRYGEEDRTDTPSPSWPAATAGSSHSLLIHCGT